jgi:hypothetical protein
MAIPRGPFGNRLDTPAGVAKEAQMQAAAHALKVAHSEAVHGRAADAQVAIQKAIQHTNNAGVAPAGQFQQAVIRDINAINAISQQSNNPPPTGDPGPGGGGGGGGSGGAPAPPPAKPASPWITSSNFVSPSGIKQADPDIVITRPEPVGPEAVLELNYEDISGMELINVSRSDLVDGKKVIYSPIKNLSKLRNKYNPNNLINVSSTSSNYFATFGIDLIARGMSTPYFDDSGDLVIEIDDIRDNELIEIDVDTSGTISLVDFS